MPAKHGTVGGKLELFFGKSRSFFIGNCMERMLKIADGSLKPLNAEMLHLVWDAPARNIPRD